MTPPPDKCPLKWQMFALSFTALFLELMVIRWVPSVVRLVAYYANLMLLSSFLGLGVGVMAGFESIKQSTLEAYNKGHVNSAAQFSRLIEGNEDILRWKQYLSDRYLVVA